MKKKIILHEAKDTDFFTVKEAAKELGIDAQSMRDHLSKGNLKTYKFKSLDLVEQDRSRSMEGTTEVN